ncbi:MAG: hypothetical protein QHG94_00960 [Candidatus Methanosuratincola sp.]|jgi:hypothetical protein|nr:hypothetical protein [Candidatus Methanosuratincola sp.]
MKGIEYLRGIYIASNLSIRPKTRLNKIDALKEIICAWGLNPEEILTKDALTKPNRTIIDNSQLENHQLVQLTAALKQQMLKEIHEHQPKNSINSRLDNGSPEGNAGGGEGHRLAPKVSKGRTVGYVDLDIAETFHTPEP